jgi:filamentous hemagglutinin family protein
MSNHRNNSPAAVALVFAALTPAALANPAGMTVVSGSASAQASGSQLNVTTGQFALLNWQTFNIVAGQTTQFIQPGAGSVVVNRISDSNPSQIWGNLVANGTVILENSHGFYFGPNSMIDIGGSFVATTAPIKPDLGADASWQFTGLPPLASIVNYGTIKTGHENNLFLIAEQIDNYGELSSPGGNITLAAGQDVLLSERPDGRGVSTTVHLPAGSVNNFGQITADAGTIALNAKVVNQDGRIQADSVKEDNGVVELVASDAVNLGADSVITANGDSSGVSSGGNITIKSGGRFSDAAGSSIQAQGGAQGGNGGNVEISAASLAGIHSQVDASVQAGYTGGTLLVDPADLTLNSSSLSPYTGFSSIVFQAADDITLAAGTVWNLSSATKLTTGQLTLEAGNDIIFGSGARITDANNWSLTLDAGYDFTSQTIQPGAGSIYLNGGSGLSQNGTIQLFSGNINLNAGESILLGTGSVTTIGGGSISADALAGDINVGTDTGGQFNSGYNYQNFSYAPYAVASNLGGISTAAGGNVTLTAGDDINSASGTAPGLAGAFGNEAGNVSIVAGNEVFGNFNVANGTGTIEAGVQVQKGQVTQILNPNANVGLTTRPVSLSLISGSWNVFSGGDIAISEVRNPNGTFNANNLPVTAGEFAGDTDNPTVPARSSFLFNYSADAAANFWAGDGITLVGANLPRVTGQNTAMPAVYAPQLSLNAGAGGITVDSPLILYPSSEGSLSIITRDGGNLSGAVLSTTLTGITMSDSGLPGWSTFANGHAITPLHLDDPNPVTLDISGDIDSFGLTVPTFAQINVTGGTYNFGFLGQNLSPSQTTSINVAGSITYRGDLTSVTLANPLPNSLLNNSTEPGVTGQLSWNAATGTLTYVGVMTAPDLAFLLNPTVYVVDSSGNPVLDANGNQETETLTLSAAQQSALQQLYTASQNATLGDQGLALAGPGKFSIAASSIDLGISGGISVNAADTALQNISLQGADIDISVAGDLDMTSTKIANESYLGNINLNVGGTLDVGGEFTTFGDPNAPKGIFTTSGGNVNVTANGDVNVDGSRIAAYDGGNISVFSQTGDINAGSGGSGFVSMNAQELDPATGQLVSLPASIPGSGILATTLPGGNAPTLGSITLNAPKGNINASLGGVIQIAFNNADTGSSAINLTAGQNIDASGSGVIGQNISLKAGGQIEGIYVGRTINADSTDLGQATFFATGPVTISTTGGGGPPPTIISEAPPTINDVSVTEPAPTAPAVAVNTQTADDASTLLSKKDGGDEDKTKKKGKAPVLKRLVGRVTLLLSKN